MQEGPAHHRTVPPAALLLAVAWACAACGDERPEPPAAGEEPAAAGAPEPAGDGPPPPAAGTALAGYDFTGGASAEGVRLPVGLEEASGLAVEDATGRLYAHGDETAVIFVLNPATGGVAARFGAGRPILRSDFEGIAFAAGRLWLVDSDGNLVSLPPGGPEEVMPHEVVRTGLGDVCEVEGLTTDPVWGALLLVCKSARSADADGRLRLYHFSLRSEALEGLPVVDSPLEELRALGLAPELNPSAVEVHPITDSYLVLASAQGLLVEVNRAGHPVAAVRLPSGGLPQPEGLAITPDGTLHVVTEGRGGAGRLFRWPWRPPAP